MAYVSKEKKAKIVEAFKALGLPKPWKITFSVNHHSTMVATIQKAPASVKSDYTPFTDQISDNIYVNEYHIDKCFKGETLEIMKKLIAVLNTDNFDKSDSMSDYFHVGHYISVNFGRWNKPCEFI